ncbi:hypothetical protein BpHYR1_006356 [Brachionus plicatilis]|uniref:Uncharacterized protein n=1 Tax=Brachionus plicatilis TaxID=10195 RepID=A0A3M7S9L7_BRAPC|nr:hypothetical protein BpHYR1_006356 [Brachionus plicatilis]
MSPSGMSMSLQSSIMHTENESIDTIKSFRSIEELLFLTIQIGKSEAQFLRIHFNHSNAQGAGLDDGQGSLFNVVHLTREQLKRLQTSVHRVSFELAVLEVSCQSEYDCLRLRLGHLFGKNKIIYFDFIGNLDLVAAVHTLILVLFDKIVHFHEPVHYGDDAAIVEQN